MELRLRARGTERRSRWTSWSCTYAYSPLYALYIIFSEGSLTAEVVQRRAGCSGDYLLGQLVKTGCAVPQKHLPEGGTGVTKNTHEASPSLT